MASILFNVTPLESIILDSTRLGSIPLDAIPLESIPLDSTPLDVVPLDMIGLHLIPLDSIILDLFYLTRFHWFGCDCICFHWILLYRNRFDALRFEKIRFNWPQFHWTRFDRVGIHWVLGVYTIGLPVWGLATTRMVATKKIFLVYQKTCLGIRKTFTNSVFHLFGNLHFES